MERGHYNGYRGRSRVRTVLTAVVCLLALLVVGAAAVLLLGQRYIVYTADGIRLELPFGRDEEKPVDVGDVSVDVVKKPPVSPPKPTQPDHSDPELVGADTVQSQEQ